MITTKSAFERTAADWFRAAMECYVAHHQGCPCCGTQHCVFRSFLGKRVEYFCSVCEFAVCLDTSTNRYHATPGDAATATICVLDVAI